MDHVDPRGHRLAGPVSDDGAPPGLTRWRQGGRRRAGFRVKKGRRCRPFSLLWMRRGSASERYNRPMKPVRAALASVLFLALARAVAAQAPAQDPAAPLPTVDEIIAKNLEAKGGAVKWQ